MQKNRARSVCGDEDLQLMRHKDRLSRSGNTCLFEFANSVTTACNADYFLRDWRSSQNCSMKPSNTVQQVEHSVAEVNTTRYPIIGAEVAEPYGVESNTMHLSIEQPQA